MDGDLTTRKQPIRYLVQDIGGDLDDSAQGLPPNAYIQQKLPEPNYIDNEYPQSHTIPFKEFS